MLRLLALLGLCAVVMGVEYAGDEEIPDSEIPKANFTRSDGKEVQVASGSDGNSATVKIDDDKEITLEVTCLRELMADGNLVPGDYSIILLTVDSPARALQHSKVESPAGLVEREIDEDSFKPPAYRNGGGETTAAPTTTGTMTTASGTTVTTTPAMTTTTTTMTTTTTTMTTTTAMRRRRRRRDLQRPGPASKQDGEVDAPAGAKKQETSTVLTIADDSDPKAPKFSLELIAGLVEEEFTYTVSDKSSYKDEGDMEVELQMEYKFCDGDGGRTCEDGNGDPVSGQILEVCFATKDSAGDRKQPTSKDNLVDDDVVYTDGNFDIKYTEQYWVNGTLYEFPTSDIDHSDGKCGNITGTFTCIPIFRPENSSAYQTDIYLDPTVTESDDSETTTAASAAGLISSLMLCLMPLIAKMWDI